MKIKALNLLFFLLLLPIFLNSQENQEVRLNAFVESRCKVEVSTHLISFTRVNPDVERLIPQNEAPLQVTIKITTIPGEKVHLRVQAEDDLVDPNTGQRIDINNIIWKATGKGFKKKGRLNKLTTQKIGSWNKSGIWNGTLTFYLENKLTYAPGVYRTVVTFTISTF